MEPLRPALRLDPADPLASLLRWLAALAQALGFDPSALIPKVELNRAGAAYVRRWLADWSRQLRILIRAEAARLARTLENDLRRRPCEAPAHVRAASRHAAAPHGRMVAVARPARRIGRTRLAGAIVTRRDPAELLTEAEDGALRLRTRAVLSALRDRSALVARLARRLARSETPRKRPHFPLPPRRLGAASPAPAIAPEPRPPDRKHTPRPT